MTHLVVGLSTMITLAPGIEVKLLQKLGLSHDVQRLPLSPSLACAGGARSLGIGARMATGKCHPATP